MPRIKVSLWLPVILCLFYRLGMGRWLFPFLAAAAVHELGHFLCVYWLGARVTFFQLSIGGAVIETTPLSYRQEALCAFAGPFAGLLMAFVLHHILPWLSFFALAQSLYNLLPVYPLDGGRALKAVLGLRLSLARVERILHLVSICVLILVFFLSMLLLHPILPWPWFILPAAALFLQALPHLWSNGKA